MKYIVTQRIKNKTHLITFVTRGPGQIVGFDKNENRIQNIVGNSPKPKFYFFGANPSYQNVSYRGKHFYFNNKSHTFTVEGVNSYIIWLLMFLFILIINLALSSFAFLI